MRLATPVSLIFAVSLCSALACVGEPAGDEVLRDELASESAPSELLHDDHEEFSLAEIIELNDNGAWSWFMDERVIVHDDRLIVGSVRAVGKFKPNKGQEGWGNVEVATYDIVDGRVDKVILHEQFEQDDHDNPAFLVRDDGRLLAVYSKHAAERLVYFRVSAPDDPLTWSEAATFTSPGVEAERRGDNVTYSNLFRWPSGRIYNFYRGFDHDPNYMFSDDQGETWTYGGRLLEGYDGYGPYLKYAYQAGGRLHFIANEDHPREHDNSVFHGYLEGDIIHHSNGEVIAPLSETTDPSAAVWDLTPVFLGDADNAAWVIDIELDADGHPYVAFSVQRDGAWIPQYMGGSDLRYFYGRWDGKAWSTEEIALAGTRLYPGEDDYSGLVALDPRDPDIAYISTDVDPVGGQPLISQADGERHYELFRGRRTDKSWTWEPVTANSRFDNLRPIVPKWADERTALVWMRGEYRYNHGEWTTSVAAMILPRVDG